MKIVVELNAINGLKLKKENGEMFELGSKATEEIKEGMKEAKGNYYQ